MLTQHSIALEDISLMETISNLPPVDEAPGVTSSEVARYAVDTALYSKEAVFRACYQFTDRCYLFLAESNDTTISVEFRKRQPAVHLSEIVGSFANELISQRVRADIARETHAIRELIVAQAFSQADFSDPV